jgi:hypothetical protein
MRLWGFSRLTQRIVVISETDPQGRKGPRRPISCDQPAKEMPQLRFITTTNPEQGKDLRTRRIVRSHVAQQFHFVRRQAWKDDDEVQGENESIPDLKCWGSLKRLASKYVKEVLQRKARGFVDVSL